MAYGKTKLELTWIGKENRPRLEPRILIEDPEKSYHAKFRTRGNRQDAKDAKIGPRTKADRRAAVQHQSLFAPLPDRLEDK